MRNFEDNSIKEYVLAKFEPGNILLVNRYNKKAYNYYQIKKSQPILQQLTHPYLLRPLIYGTGLLYPKGQTNLMIELDNRKRAFNKQYFGEDELINTFLPLFQCVDYLHKNKVTHGQIHPENIVLIEGEIKLRDWLVQSEDNSYYGHPRKQNKNSIDDFVAIGQIIAQFATLKKSSNPLEQKQVDLAIESVIQTYSKQLIFVLLILLKKRKQFFNEVIPLLRSKATNILDNYELNDLYTRIKSTKASKVIKPQPIQKIINIAPTPKKIQNALVQSSPNKKFNITHTSKKSSHRLDDTQNKKVFNQQVKKRQIQKITKIIQRSNAFVNQLMARKNNNQFGALKNNSQHNGLKNSSQLNGQQVLKKISGKNNVNLGVTMTNMSMYAVDATKKVKQTTSAGLMFSPNKRMRTISRKK